MNAIQPCLWFDSTADEAAKLYTSLFKNSKPGQTVRYGKAGAKASGQKEGTTMTVEFEIEGLKIYGINGGPIFKHTPASSLFVWCDTEQEIDHLWKGLSQGGTVRMGLDKYPWAQKYGWTADRYGVEWQLFLKDKDTKNHAKIATCFLFGDELFGRGEEAIGFYTSIFKDSKINFMHKDEKTGTVMHCQFTINGTPFVIMDAPGKHGYTFTEAFSNMVMVKTQAELDNYWSKLSAHPENEMCGWLKDKFGVSWQITPADLSEMHKTPEMSDRVMDAVVKMRKLDLEKIRKAAYGS